MDMRFLRTKPLGVCPYFCTYIPIVIWGTILYNLYFLYIYLYNPPWNIPYKMRDIKTEFTRGTYLTTSQELLENSLDAASRRIVILVKSGGLKMLRIEDDGHGIRHQDLPILCERFTTSKLQNYDDLLRIGTFGFRGEALASISHVAQVTVTTMTSQDSCASVAHYSEGQLKGQVRPCAGTRGTTVVVENMFYNNPTRRQALGKESLEHAKVLEVVQRYSIHYPHVAFGCRKSIGSSGGAFELSTAGGEERTTREVIGTIWGQNLANEVFPFEPRWWFQTFLFSSLFGEDSHFDDHIFQMGRFNHQPGANITRSIIFLQRFCIKSQLFSSYFHPHFVHQQSLGGVWSLKTGH